ncbi:MAG: polyhydroxyalkanoate synthesis repressor PhaR [Alphaproteobacteria bacterium]|nr:polyhydroxyalkanoate synthesis repressor PhaR [Alphaproteobacteria bacterium]
MNETPPKETITIKKYANRRLYNTATSSYVTLENLSTMVKDGVEFHVYDAKTSEDITHSVLTQIIFEEEGKSGQQNLLPVGFLRQLIGFYGDNMQWMVPKYLEHSMKLLSQNQEQMRGYFESAFGNSFGNMFPFGSTLEEMSKQNLAMFESTMRMFSPFAMTGGTDSEEAPQVKAKAPAAPTATAAPATAPIPPAPAATVTAMPKRSEVKAAKAAPAPEAPVCAAPAPTETPMPNVQNATAANATDDMQQKIANLQRQLADLAKTRG